MLRRFLNNESGGGAAEFALVLPVFLLFLLGIIDVGRYAWALNEAEKATQVGARWAVVTDMLPSDLATYSFAVDPEVPLPQGDPISETDFPGVDCESEGGVLACECAEGGNCEFSTAVNDAGQASFDELVARMRSIYPHMDANGDDITIEYRNSGLGFAGDPNGPDVSPLVRVALRDQGFPMFFLLGMNVPMPSFSYTLTSEDASGDFANY
jgi:hypothetical protein